jgi:hypothetical protein
MEEIWRIIDDAPDYAVSNLGRVKRVTKGIHTFPGRILNQQPNRAGYMVCQLLSKTSAANKNGKVWRCTHRLVLEAFVGKRPGGQFSANHIIPDKTNNRIDNLEWVTITENNVHALRTGQRSNGQGDTSRNHKLKEGEVWLIKKLLHSGKVTQRFIAKMFRVHYATINEIKRGRNWSHVTYP